MSMGGYQGYQTETPKISEAQLAATWLGLLDGGPHQKEASERTNSFIRDKMREKSFARLILTPQTLGDEEVDRRVESDLPIKIVEKEPDSRATFVTFKGAGPRAWIKGQRYAVHFGYISSQRWRKNKLELMTSRTDLKELLADNAVKDCAAQEDGKFLETALEITAAAAATQVINFTSRLSKDGIVSGIQAMLANQIPAGVMLCTQQLWWDLARLQANNIGDPATDRLWQNGVEKTELFGMRCITTIKNDIVDPNDLWIFAPEQYLGNFFLLQDATLFIKQEGPEIMFYVYEAPGIGFGNTKGIIRIRFNRAVA